MSEHVLRVLTGAIILCLLALAVDGIWLLIVLFRWNPMVIVAIACIAVASYFIGAIVRDFKS